MARLTKAEAMRRFDEIGVCFPDDPDALHAAADEILLELAPPEVRAAYLMLKDWASWWEHS